MDELKILSLGRNQIKKIEALDGVADTLEELWMSYNFVEALKGIEKLHNLRVLYLSNNKIKDFDVLDPLKACEKLEDLLLVGNPLYPDKSENPTALGSTYRIEVLKR